MNLGEDDLGARLAMLGPVRLRPVLVRDMDDLLDDAGPAAEHDGLALARRRVQVHCHVLVAAAPDDLHLHVPASSSGLPLTAMWISLNCLPALRWPLGFVVRV